MVRKVCLVFFLLLSLSCVLFSETIDEVENPKTARNAWVSDGAGIIDENTEAQMNAFLDDLEKKTAAEIAVATVKKCEDVVGGQRAETDVKEFAMKLFNVWGIGKKGKDNGVLMVVSIGQRRIEVETGYGVEGILTDGQIGSVLDNYVMAYFKEGKFGDGVLSGVREMGELLLQSFNPEAFREEMEKKKAEEVKAALAQKQRDAATRTLYGVFSALLFLNAAAVYYLKKVKASHVVSGAATFFSAAFLPFLIGAKFTPLFVLLAVPPAYYSWFRIVESGMIQKAGLNKKLYDVFLSRTSAFFVLSFFAITIFAIARSALAATPQTGYTDDKIANGIIFLFIYGVGFGALYGGVAMFFYDAMEKMKQFIPHLCARCQKLMTLLPREEEKTHLQDWQSLEEDLGSMNYDVWFCTPCNYAETVVLKGKGNFTRCPECGHTTFKSIQEKTVTQPTYDSTGVKEILRRCMYVPCSFEKLMKETLARLERPSSSSSRSSYSRRRSSWGSSGGSSYHSSGSFGGGHSGGGGAGRSW